MKVEAKKNDSFIIGQEIHKQREKQSMFQKSRLDAQLYAMKYYKERNMNTENIIIEHLQKLGFNIENVGTYYIADVCEQLYLEKKVFDPSNTYFDFNDVNNLHYLFADEYYECGLFVLLEEIKKAIKGSNVENCSMNEIIYNVVNEIINQYDAGSIMLDYKER